MSFVRLMPYKFSFITTPGETKIRQIRILYRNAGWWEPEDDDQQALIRRIVLGSHCFLTVMKDGQMIGMGRAISDGVNDAYLQDITVLTDFRHLGLGTQIVEKIVDRLRHDGLQWIGLIAGGHSHPFYRRLGFVEMPFSTPMLLQKGFKS